MADILFVGVLVAFFALAALLVKGCDRMIGGARSQSSAEAATVEAEHEVAA